MRMESGNLEAHLTRGFPLDSLPRTIYDAVRLTPHLGLHYLVVDALCIIQGNDDAANEDWDREASRMGELSANAHVTFSAAVSRNAENGIFSCGRCIISYEDGGNALCDSFDSPSVEGEHISSRGWTFQEHMLSPRHLLFTKDVPAYA